MGLKIALITPWGKSTRCGIRTYSENLAHALAELGVEVYVVRWPRLGRRSRELVESSVLDKIPADRVDLIHVQNEYGLFAGDFEDLSAWFYSRLRGLGLPIVTTMHAVGDWRRDNAASAGSAGR